MNRPNPLLDETAAEIVSDGIWNLLEERGVPGLPLSHCERSEKDAAIQVKLSSGHTVWIAVLPEAPRFGARFIPRHRRPH